MQRIPSSYALKQKLLGIGSRCRHPRQNGPADGLNYHRPSWIAHNYKSEGPTSSSVSLAGAAQRLDGLGVLKSRGIMGVREVDVWV